MYKRKILWTLQCTNLLQDKEHVVTRENIFKAIMCLQVTCLFVPAISPALATVKPMSNSRNIAHIHPHIHTYNSTHCQTLKH